MRELLVQLSPKQEELIELHFLEGWSNGELAQRFGVSPAAISKTIKKGLLSCGSCCLQRIRPKNSGKRKN